LTYAHIFVVVVVATVVVGKTLGVKHDNNTSLSSFVDEGK